MSDIKRLEEAIKVIDQLIQLGEIYLEILDVPVVKNMFPGCQDLRDMIAKDVEKLREIRQALEEIYKEKLIEEVRKK